jgi:hypothetical protein
MTASLSPDFADIYVLARRFGKATLLARCLHRAPVLGGCHAESCMRLGVKLPGLGSVPDAGPAGGAGAPLVVPGLGWVRALMLSRWLGCSMHGLAGSGRDSGAGRIRSRGRGSGIGGRGWLGR